MDDFSFGSFMKEGGWGMVPVLLLGVATVAAAGRYAARPDASWLRFVSALWVTLIVVVMHAVVTDVAAVFQHTADPARTPDAELPRILLIGLKESTRPAALGGVFLTLAPLLAAVGLYRISPRRAIAE